MSTSRTARHLSSILIIFSGGAFSACAKPIKVKVIDSKRVRVESTVNSTSSGTVEADQQAVLGFSTSGRVSRVHVRPGDTVRKGQLLAELESTDLQTISRDAATELGRARELFSSGLVSKAALDEASKASEVARASLDRAVIRAPFGGLITEVNLEVGELPNSATATAGKAPVRIVDLNPRLIRGSVDETDLAHIKVGAPARIKIPAVRQQPFQGEVTRVVPFVSTIKEQDRTSLVEFKIVESDSKEKPLILPVGASADIEIVIDAKDTVLAVPTRAILGSTGKRFLFIREGKLAKRVDLKTGLFNYDRTEILEGIQEGAQVLLPPDDAELKDGLKIETEIQPWP
jgi:HlyD family secretion protein